MKKYLFLFAFLFLISFCIAQPPFQQTTIISKGIQIETPIIETHKFNETFDFHIHAHNATDGLLLTNTTTNCIIHIYKPSDGGHVIEMNMTFCPTNQVDFEAEIEGGNFTEVGQYAVLFYCEVPGEIGGFFEYAFDVTNEGTTLSLSDSFIRVSLLIFFVAMFAGLYHVVGGVDFKKWNDKIVERYKAKNFVKMILSIFAYNVLKNFFIIYYLIGLPIFLILKDITYTYNIAGLILFMDVLLMVYIIGILIVAIIFLSYVQEWAWEMWELVKDMKWGVEGNGK